MENENVILIRAKAPETEVFIYSGIEDLEKLAVWLDAMPSVTFKEGKIIPKFKKFTLEEPLVIWKNIEGGILKTLPLNELESNFVILKSK